MLTRDQAVEAAFYTGANLLSFTDERAANLQWMGCELCDLPRMKPAAAAIVRNQGTAFKEPLHAVDIIARMVERQLFDQGLVTTAITLAMHQSYACFVTVLLVMDGLIDAEMAVAEVRRVNTSPPPEPSANFIDDDDRIDRQHPDPLDRIQGAPAPAALAPRKSKKS